MKFTGHDVTHLILIIVIIIQTATICLISADIKNMKKFLHDRMHHYFMELLKDKGA